MTIEQLYQIFRQHPVITTDSRDVPAGSIFFALKGDTFDGNLYALAALEQGAAYAVVDSTSAVAAESDDSRILTLTPSADALADTPAGAPVSALQALQCLARYHRRQLGTTVIGITGTNGKTTTKELITAVLRKKYNVLSTQGNFNNHIGVPKTLLGLTPEHQMAVVEMGANHPGEIRTLVGIACPDYGIITNVGKAHLEGFGSFEGVLRTKGELYDYLRNYGGTVFINNDNHHLLSISHDLHVVKYGQTPAADLLLHGWLTGCNPYVNFVWTPSGAQSAGVDSQEGLAVSTHLIGSYNLDNLLAAACIGTYFGVSPADICDALAQYTPTNNRSQLTVTPYNRLIVDAYNANPTSMAAALDNFNHIQASHKMVILGDMKELGADSQAEHQAVLARLAAATDIESVWLVGTEFEEASSALAACSEVPDWCLFRDVDAVIAALQNHRPEGRTILIKGSNSTHLVRVIDYL